MTMRALAVVPLFAAALAAQGKVDFQKQVWPVLQARCVECHAAAHMGADGKMKKPKGGVVLDSKDGMLGSDGLIVAKDASGGREFENSMIVQSTINRFTTVFYHSGGSVAQNWPTASLSAGVWHFLAFRHINSTGVITGRVNTTTTTFTRPAGQTWNATSTAFALGSRLFSPFQQYFNGLIDECARWNRALSDAELDTLYNSGTGIDLRK